MDTAEICRLSKRTIARLLIERGATCPGPQGNGRRRAARWPFPGTVELWIPNDDGSERHELATSLNLSSTGVGIRCDEPLPSGVELSIAIHEPEISLHGRAVVRHCTDIGGDYLVGLAFQFETD